MPLYRPEGYAVDAQWGWDRQDDGDEITDGQDQNRNTAGSFTSQSGNVRWDDDLKITKVLWDIRNTGTYMLSFDGLDLAQVVVSSAPAADVEFVLPRPIFVASGITTRVKLTRTASTTWSDRNAGTYDSSYWYESGIYYDATSYGMYTLPIKFVFRVWIPEPDALVPIGV